MAPRNRNLLVGLVVLGSVLALAWMLLKFSGRVTTSFFQKGTEFHLASTRADGVSEGTPVFYLGVNVGRVTGVRREPNNQGVAIDAVTETKLPLPSNVVGIIRQQSPLGSSAVINLEPDGPPSSQPLANGANIRAQFLGGGVVPPEFGELATEIRQRQLITHLDESVESINQLVRHFNELAGDKSMQENIRTTIASVRRTSENLEKLTAHADELTGETRSTLAQVRTTVGDTGQRVNDLSKQLGGQLHQVGDVLGKFDSIAGKIDKGQGTAGQFVNDPRLYESLVDTSRELNETVRTLKRLSDQWEHEGVSLKLK